MTSGPELDALDAATARFHEADRAREEARREVIGAVVAALRAGGLPTEVAGRSPFTAAHVRTIAREHGIPPARPGVKSKTRG